jgi:S-ribosylhomocysteine lyase
MRRIASFSVNHDKIGEGMYVSRIDGDITTFDLRMRKPNMVNYIDNLTIHSLEHMFATYVRNSEIGANVIYFGPMGCQTGFYLLTRDTENEIVLSAVKNVLEKIINHNGEMFGNTREECGNYRNLNLDAAKLESQRYLDILNSKEVTFKYEE